MPIPSPVERPDLYDGYDGIPSTVPLTAEYLLSITPSHIKAAIEAKTGKPFIESVEAIVAEHNAHVKAYHG